MTKKTGEDPIVNRKIGKKHLQMRKSHRLPFYYAEFPFYDRALPRICKKINKIDGYLVVVDIGANIGDTVSLITDEVQGSFLCIEGDSEYLPLLKNNLGKLEGSQVFIEESYCSENGNKDSNLKIERIDGTAKIVSTNEKNGSPGVQFKTLDNIIKQHSSFEKANIVKIDTDGFEINVLKGGKKFLREAKPILFFEFTPELYLANNQNPLFVFEFLNRNGYHVALMYDNFGRPVEIINTSDKTKIEKLLDLIDNNKICYYDILTYHHSKKEKYNVMFENELMSCFSLIRTKLDSTKIQLDTTKTELDTTKSRLDAYKSQIKSFENALVSTKEELDSKKTELDLAKTELDTTKTELDTTESQLNSIKTKIDSLKDGLISTKSQLDTAKTELSSSKFQLDSAKTELSSSKFQLDSAKTELKRIYSSRGWKTLLILQKIVKIIFPKESSRRKIMVGSLGIAKAPLRLVRKIKDKLLFHRSYFYKFLKPKKRRKINTKSKKIVYIGHSYHNKTKSTEFLTDYLKQFYDVKVILDESWQGEPFPDLSFIDENYLGVIFFQNLPNQKILKKIKNDNLIFFPMYDSVGLDYAFWNNYKNLKIINFSKTLHEKLAKWGFESMYIQYFPDFQKFNPGNKDEVFFWQRLTKININTIAKLFGKEKLKIHIHKAIDPEHQFIKPSKEDEEKFRITYSGWLETRREMWDLIKQKGIYIAPREFEGIGLSFLEAMAMGKAVIAVNNPTMNEYIEHNKTGYLFDLSDPKKIDLLNINQVQRNTYDFMRDGRKKWEKDKHRIIGFIKKK